MGYFQRPIDRARCRAEAAALAEQPLPELPWSRIPRKPPTKSSLVRFSTLVEHDYSGHRAGFLTFSAGLIRSEETHPATAEGMKMAREWFCEHLHSPDLDESKAIFFFKTEARTCMAKAWELIHWMEEAGVLVEMQTMPNGRGRIVYEDEFQVAIIPHADAGVR